MEIENIIIFHSPCPDGFCSALIAYTIFGKNAYYCKTQPNNKNFIETFPYSFANKNVYIFDISFSKEIIMKIENEAKQIVLIDHHKTALEELYGIPFCHINTDHSAAYLVWKYFYPDIPIPQIILYIQDKDLWKNILPNTIEINSIIANFPFEIEKFPFWIDYLNDDKMTLSLKDEGYNFIKTQNIIINNIIKYYDEIEWVFENRLYKIYIICTNLFITEIGDKLCQNGADIAVMYRHNFISDKFIYSFRTKCVDIDVSDIAKKICDGGGHKQASGGSSVISPKKLFGNIQS